MFTKVDFFGRYRRVGGTALGAALAAALLAACTWTPPLANLPPAATVPAPAASSTSANGTNDASAVEAAAAAASTASGSAALVPERDAIIRVLAYFDRVRSQSAAELSQEVARLGNPYVPANQLQLALALGQLRQTPELVRAQELLTRLLANTDAEAQVLHPLARLLAARFGEQRRLEDLLDKQTQQTRDVQRRLDQTNERLEALKAIERSLTSRPPVPVAPGAPAPINRSRPPAP